MKKSGFILLPAIILLQLFLSITMFKPITAATMTLPEELSQPIIATPIPFPVYVDDQLISFGAYLVEGNSYFKLRDLAYVLDGTDKQFSVGWDAFSNAISLNRGQPYSPVGGEMDIIIDGEREAIPAVAKLYIDGWETTLTAFNIDGNNYFKVRDMGQTLDFSVVWDDKIRCMRISIGQCYIPDDGDKLILPNLSLSITAEISTDYEEAINIEVYKWEVVRLVNEERAKIGLSALIADAEMFASAQIRAEELPYEFSHTRPNSLRFFTVFDELDIEYAACSENIAMSQRGPQRVVQLWMDSAGHRKNILGDYTRIGVGITKIANYYYWEMTLVR